MQGGMTGGSGVRQWPLHLLVPLEFYSKLMTSVLKCKGVIKGVSQNRALGRTSLPRNTCEETPETSQQECSRY